MARANPLADFALASPSNKTVKLPDAAEPNVVIGVGRPVVEVASKDPGIGTIVPVATTDQGNATQALINQVPPAC